MNQRNQNDVRDHMLIRHESPDDILLIRAITERAFANSSLGYHGEADLIDAIRSEDSRTILSLVAEVNAQVCGHVFFSPVIVRTDRDSIKGMGLAPMAVLPEHQHAGVGSALVEEGIRKLQDLACPFVAVLGHVAFYARLGFRPASDLGLTHGFAGIPQEVFLYRLLDASLDCRRLAGRAFYASEFGKQHERAT